MSLVKHTMLDKLSQSHPYKVDPVPQGHEGDAKEETERSSELGDERSPRVELILVTNITNNICREKIVTWRNFGEILGNFGKIWEILPQFMRFHVEKNLAQKVRL